MSQGRMPIVNMDIIKPDKLESKLEGIDEEEYLKKPIVQRDEPKKKEKKKRKMTEKQLENLAKARQISASNRAKAKAEKAQQKKESKKEKKVSIQEPIKMSIDEAETESESSSEEDEFIEETKRIVPVKKEKKKKKKDYYDLNNYLDKIIDGIYGKMSSDKDKRNKEKEARLKSEDDIRKDERKKFMDTLGAISHNQKQVAPKKTIDAQKFLSRSKYDDGMDWDSCFKR